MGNQPGKSSKRSIHQFPIPDSGEKKSRTDWTAGVPLSPGKPVVQLSSRSAPMDESSVTDEINLTWGVPKDDGGYPITGYRIEMLDIQTNHWIEITFIEGFEPRCTLSNILYGIMYRFRVIAYNDAGPSEPGDPSDPVVIDVPGVQIAPYFVLMLNDTIALEHEKVEFRVKVLGTPKPTVQWFKDDMEVFSSDRLDIREEEDGGSVVVREARLSDSGNIKCVATNILGRATSVGQLIIEAAPRLDLPEVYNDGLIFRYDEVIRLKIPMIAKPSPRVTWFFDDEPICASDDVWIETTDTVTSLKIGAAKRWHCGEFRVLAQNENGEDSASILVTVTAPPSPAGKPVIIDITGTTCILRWEGVQDDGGADIKHYIVEYFRDVWDVWLKAKTTKECQVSIEDLIPGSRYKFRIKAENAYGISTESEESDPFDVGGVQPQEVSRLLSPPTICVSPDMLPSSPRRKTWKEMNTGSLTDDGWNGSQEAWSPPQRQHDLTAIKQGWDSVDSTDEINKSNDDVLKDLLRVKKYAQRVSSIESDGLPSIASVDYGDDVSYSESSEMTKARQLYAELQAMSMDSTEEMSDLDAAAKEFYNEIRALSMETGGSIENILDNIGASSESLASLIPLEKRQELAGFEMSLKQMIEEARQLADSASPGSRSLESLHAAGRSFSGQRRDSAGPAARTPDYERRSRKSNSVASQPDSVVSVIEAAAGRQSSGPGRVGFRPEAEEEEPRPMSERGRPTERKPAGVRMPAPPVADSADFEKAHPPAETSSSHRRLQEQESGEELEQAPPLEAVAPPPAPVAAPRQSSATKSTTPQAGGGVIMGGGRRGQVVNREPSVGADRYEDIIVETRKRSQSRGNSRMGSRSNSSMDFRTSQSDFGGRVDLESLRSGSNKSLAAALDLDTRVAPTDRNSAPLRQSFTPELQKKRVAMTPEQDQLSKMSLEQEQAIKRLQQQQQQQQLSMKMALDANQNATEPSLPVTGPMSVRPKLKVPVKPDAMVNMFPKNIPHWFVITYTYSVVLILILLIANSTPDGKLYIHFTAFWSLALYFLLEDDQANDILDSMVDSFLKK